MRKFKLITSANEWVGDKLTNGSWKVSVKCSIKKTCINFTTPPKTTLSKVMGTIEGFEEQMSKL